MRPVTALIDPLESAWPAIKEAIETAPSFVTVLPITREQAERSLVRLQVTTRSVLGALAFETGGLLVDGGWLRILGGGWTVLPDVATANGMVDSPPPRTIPGALLMALDVVGGRFAVNDTAFDGRQGEVHYFAPDSLRWEPLGLGHGEFVLWSMSLAPATFYESLRWPGWEEEVGRLQLDEGLLLNPPPFVEGAHDLSTVTRTVVPWDALPPLYDEAARELG
jgi:hypothetical protein